MTRILSGMPIQAKIEKELSGRVQKLDRKPTLAIISVDPRPESLLYIEKKKDFGERIGCRVEHLSLDPQLSLGVMKERIGDRNADPNTDGVIIQLPIRSRLHTSDLLDSVDASKDVDGLSSYNVAALVRGEERFIPAATRAVFELLSQYEIPIEGKHVTVVGDSLLVGRPTAFSFLNRRATVTICHRGTIDLADRVRFADIVISATGSSGLITADMVRAQQTVIDVGTAVEESGGAAKGDVDFENVAPLVEAITPVPGGVGPLTVASLFLNLIEAAEQRGGKEN